MYIVIKHISIPDISSKNWAHQKGKEPSRLLSATSPDARICRVVGLSRSFSVFWLQHRCRTVHWDFKWIHATIKTTSFPGTSVYFSTGWPRLQSWPAPNSEYMEKIREEVWDQAHLLSLGDNRGRGLLFSCGPPQPSGFCWCWASHQRCWKAMEALQRGESFTVSMFFLHHIAGLKHKRGCVLANEKKLTELRNKPRQLFLGS